ncbi:MAG: M23 family metallopeptidase [Candidatus Binatia bacterium]
MKTGGLVAFSLCLLAQASFAGEAPWIISLKSPEVLQGGVVEIKVLGGDLARVKGLSRNQEIPFFPREDRSYAALLGVDLEERPGPMGITIKVSSKGGKKRERLITLNVRKRVFPQESLSVSAAYDRIDEATRRRIEKEQAQIARLWAISSPRRLWEGRFLAPVPGKITSPFGLRRIINGSPRSSHGGVDLRASLGTEVVAANHGRVVLREEFFFSGKSIVLDHGGGLYTMYFHLADFRVKKSSRVLKGDLIGWAGMTGRVTGPHLHWGVRLNGARVDPLEFLEAVGNRRAMGKRE